MVNLFLGLTMAQMSLTADRVAIISFSLSLSLCLCVCPCCVTGSYTQNDIVMCLAKDRYFSVDLCSSDVLFWKDPLRFEGEQELSAIDPELRELWLSQEIPGELQLEQYLQTSGHLKQTEIEHERRSEALLQGARFDQQAASRQPRKKRRKNIGNHSNNHLLGEKGYEFLSALSHKID